MTDRGSTIAYYSRQHHKDPGIIGFFGTGYPIRAMDGKYDAYHDDGGKMVGPPNEGRNNANPAFLSGLITIAGVPQSFFNLQLININNPFFAYRGTRTNASGIYRFDWMPPGDYEVVVRDPVRAYRTKIIHASVYRPQFANAPITGLSMIIGAAITAQLTTINAQQPVVYTLSSGALPAGTTLNPDGTFAGVTTASATYSGEFSATDAGGRVATQAFSIDVGSSFRYWRILFDANDGSALYDGIEEMEMRSTVGGADQTTPSGAVTAALGSSEINTFNQDQMAFDDSNGFRWLSAAAGGSWLRYDFGTPIVIRQVTIVGPSSTLTSSPKDFRIQSSPDAVAWTTQLVVTGQTGWLNGQVRTFNL